MKIRNKLTAFIEALRLSNIKYSILPAYASSSAKVYPYQIAAARFALRSDFLKGCILCDEASLGKTYEALLIAGQMLYEGKSNILIIVPSSLVNQWMRKIEQDFTFSYTFWNNTKEIPKGLGFVITTYKCAENYSEKIRERKWDLVIFDEADVLAKPEKQLVIKLKNAVQEAYKLLLTPTPITLSIMDIYGLIHFIDESVLPDADWFYKRYFRKSENYHELTEWVSQFCFRTLKCQTTDYVNFTRRIPITVNYELSKEEKLIYKLISAYIITDTKAAYPDIDNYNLNLLFFKTLSSSPQAFSNMLNAPIKRAFGLEKQMLTEIQKRTLELSVNSKTNELLKILKTVFKHLTSMRVNKKAIIFVENNITRFELYKIFTKEGYNTLEYEDIYTIDRFREEKEIQILITNDEAAKGLDIEFCPVVVNYDLPYDSVKIEQRICRCHRQGQKSDVLVINLLSKENFADVRILELINKRTLQFNGIFGMSDDIVGNFDTKIKDVLKDFRHRDEVAEDFKENLNIHREQNERLVENTEDILFTTFSKEIEQKVCIVPKIVESQIEELNNDLWELIKFHYTYNDNHYKVDEKERTLTKINSDEKEDVEYKLGYYNSKQYVRRKGREKYGMSKDLPYYERLTFTSPMTKAVLYRYTDFCGQEGVYYVNEEIKPYELVFYKINFLGGGRYFDISFLIGQDIDGNILSDEECRKLLLELSVFKTFESTYDKKLTLDFFEQDFKENAGYLRDKITKEQCFQRLMEEKAGSIDYAVRRLKMTAHSKKISLDIGIKKTREDFFALKREIENSTYTNIESIKMQKKLKLLKNELNKKEYNLSLSKQKIDMETEKEIEDLKDIRKYHIEYREQHHIYLYPKSAYKE